ncbi:MAG: type IV pilus secretin family protein [Deltaproteobacteria bacterium]|nr:MAG: type IV pilus secretin family protein [Deltaproteobacteria bacterium]
MSMPQAAAAGPRPSTPRSLLGGHKMKSVERKIRGLFALGLAAGLALAAGPARAQQVQVQAMQVVPGDTTQVVLTLDRVAAGSAVSSFTMSDPDRVIVDIADASLADAVTTIEGAGDLVDRVEAESFDDGQGLITRVRIYLKQGAEHRVVTEGGVVRIELTPGSGNVDPMADALAGGALPQADSGAGSSDVANFTVPGQYTQAPDSAGGVPSGPCLSGSGCSEDQLPPGPRVRSLDFNQLADVSRIIIGTHATKNYTASQPSDNLIVVDLPGAYVPKSLQRVIDTSQFYSPVRSVRAYPTRSGARVAINLRTNTQYTVHEAGDNQIFVDVAVPASMQQQAEAGQLGGDVAPAGPADQGLKSAYASEVYIGAGGATAAPQSAFNQGVGIGDPSSVLGMSTGFMVDQSAGTGMTYTGRKISLDFVNADIHSIFRLISSVSRLNIVAGDDVKGLVTVRMEDVPWDQAFAAILQAKGLGSQRYGNIVRVAPLETLKAEQQARLEAKRATEELKDLNMMVIPLNYADANEVKIQMQTMVSPKGSVDVDERTNQIVVRETDDRLAQIRELVRQLDLSTPQVLIEARVVEASSNFSRSLGIQWGGSFDASAATGYSTGLLFPNSIRANGGVDSVQGGEVFFTESAASTDTLLVDLGASSATSAINLNLGSIPGLLDLDARLSAAETDGFAKVISAPRITTVDNEEARISQGQRIPYLSTSAGGTQVQFIVAALELNVTPHVTSDGKIFLDVEVTNNRADFSVTVQGQPAIQIKEAQTEVLVPDGDTTVIGGVFSTEEAESYSRTPGLAKIPLLGYLFRNSSKSMTRNELLVFLTPHIVTQAEELD